MLETSETPGAASACDRCYIKKTKCDKRNPCKNCVDANAVCQRIRQRNPRRRRQARTMTDTIRSLTGRMHDLESLLHERVPAQNVEAEAEVDYDMDSARSTSDIQDNESRETFDARTRPPVDKREVPSQPQQGGFTSPERLRSNISFKQRSALDRILAVLDQFSQRSSLGDWRTANDGDTRDRSIYDLTPSDIVHVLQTSRAARPLLHCPSWMMIASSTTQTMGLALLDNSSQPQNDRREQLQYSKIILNFEAAVLLGQECSRSRSCQTDKLQAHIQLIQMQKLAHALVTLDQIPFRAAPSLSLLQAQCIGVAILQYFGNVPEAWGMMVAVSRTFVALGYDSSQEDSGRNEDVKRCIAWCYRLDQSMSLVLRRPCLLPALSTSLSFSSFGDTETQTEADSAKLDDLIRILLDFGVIQGDISVVTAGTAPVDWGDMEPVHGRLRRLQGKIENWKLTAPDPLVQQLEPDLLFLDFRYYATQTILLQQCAELASSSQVQRQVVHCALKSFESLDKLIHRGYALDLVYASWDILLYSLSPLCVLVHNIVRHQKPSDLALLRAYSTFVRDRIINDFPPPGNPLARRVHNLCMAIIEICEPLVFASTSNSDAIVDNPAAAVATWTSKHAYPTNHTPWRKNFMNFDAFFANTDSAPSGSSSGSSRSEKGADDQQDGLLLRLLAFRPGIKWDFPR